MYILRIFIRHTVIVSKNIYQKISICKENTTFSFNLMYYMFLYMIRNLLVLAVATKKQLNFKEFNFLSQSLTSSHVHKLYTFFANNYRDMVGMRKMHV